MGRRRKQDLPQLRNHNGYARLRLLNHEYSLGKFGSEEAVAEYDRLIAEFLASGRTEPPPSRKPARGSNSPSDLAAVNDDEGPLEPTVHAASPTTAAPAAAAAELPSPTCPDGITVGELSSAYLDYVEQNLCPRGKDRTSRYYTARQAIKELRPYWSQKAADFGSKLLTDLRNSLANPTKPTEKDTPQPQGRNRKPLTRKTINGIVQRIIHIFEWGTTQELVPDSTVLKLKRVQPLRRGQSLAPEGKGKEPVSDSDIDATLPYLPDSLRDLIRVARHLGCRPCEIREMRLHEIDRRADLYKGTWVYRPSEWKTMHFDQPTPPDIVIGPAAQKILAPWLALIENEPTKHVFSPLRSLSSTPNSATKRGSRAKWNDFFARNYLNRVVGRACDKAGVPRWTVGQIRHTKLTEARSNGGLEHAQRICGHSSAMMTEHYAKMKLESRIEAVLQEEARA